MKGAPPRGRLTPTEYDQINAIIKAVDERGRQIDDRWGHGRLPALVSPEWASRFASQARKFNHAVWEDGVAETQKHGEAMIRAYDKLEALAKEAGHRAAPPEQWEFETEDGLVILVKDLNRVNQVETLGRRCQVWSLDEIAMLLKNAPILIECKKAFDGIELVETRPAKKALAILHDDQIPF